MQPNENEIRIRKMIDGKPVPIENFTNYSKGYEKLKSYLLENYGEGKYRFYVYEILDGERKLRGVPVVQIP